MEALWAFSRTVLSFVVSLGILIFIHEFGHFLAAKIFRVKVERFSLGFGPRLFGKQVGDTDYRISAFPLGGYVKMLGESTDEEIPENLYPVSFSHQPLRRRITIVAAGPTSNLLLAVILYAIIFALFGLTKTTTHIGSVTPDSPAAAAGLQTDDKVLEVEGRGQGQDRVRVVAAGVPPDAESAALQLAEERLVVESEPLAQDGGARVAIEDDVVDVRPQPAPGSSARAHRAHRAVRPRPAPHPGAAASARCCEAVLRSRARVARPRPR